MQMMPEVISERDKLFELHNYLTSKGLEIMRVKNHDYTNNGDPYANFRMSEFLGIKPELALLIRVMDKIKRIETFIEQGELKVKDESVEDAIIDCINYMVLLAGLIGLDSNNLKGQANDNQR